MVLEVEPDGAAILDRRQARSARSPIEPADLRRAGPAHLRGDREGYAPVEGDWISRPARRCASGSGSSASAGGGRGAAAPARPRGASAGGAQARRRRRAGRARCRCGSASGVTGALAIGGAITGFAALSKHSQYEDAARERRRSARTARRDGKRLAGVTDILLGGAVVAAGVTAYYYFAVYRPRARRAPVEPGERARRRAEAGAPARAVRRATGWPGWPCQGRFW